SPHVLPSELIKKISYILKHLADINIKTLGLVASLILCMVMVKKFYSKSPHFLLAVALGITLNAIFSLGYEDLQDRFGSISLSLPYVAIPRMSFSMVVAVLPSSFMIALLAGIEALLSAVVADSMSGDKHHSNTELLAQGFANIGSAMVA